MRGPRFFRTIFLWLVVLLAFFVVTEAVSASGAQQKEVVLKVTSRGDVGNLARDEARVKHFNETYPWIKIQLAPFPNEEIHRFDTQLTLEYSAGAGPDMVMLDFEPLEHVMNGNLLPLDQFTTKDKEFQSWKYWHPGQLDQYRYFGKLYALPRGLYTYHPWANVDLFQKAGLALPKWGYTWADFVDMGKKLTKDTNGDGTVDQYFYDSWGMFHEDLFYPFVQQLGGELYTYDKDTGLVNGSALNDPRTIAAMQWYADLHYKHKIAPVLQSTELSAMGISFPLGKFALGFGATWSVGGNRDSIGTKFNWQPVPLPTPKAGTDPIHHVLQRPYGSISKSCKNPEEAWLFLKFYASPKEEDRIYREVPKYIEQGMPNYADSPVTAAWLQTTPPGPDAMNFGLDVIRRKAFYWAPENKLPRGYEEWIEILSRSGYDILRGNVTVQQWVDDNYKTINDSLVWTPEIKAKIEAMKQAK